MNWWVWVTGAWILAAPGIIVSKALRVRGEDIAVRCALIVAAGMSFWPLLTLWSSLAGFHWSSRSARGFVLLLSIAAVAIAIVDRRRWLRRMRCLRASWPWSLAFLALAGTTVWTRWMHARSLALPPWVDGVHHAMIIRLILDHGSIPRSLSPYIPGGDLYYHVGFHALAAWTAWLAGTLRPIDIPRLLLDFGQFLNSLTLLMVYPAARVLLRSRWAALIAGGLATLVSYFPAYYLSWGRYTHLAGILLLPALVAVLWRLARHPDWRTTLFATLLACGLVLIHVRIAFFAAVIAFELGMILLVQRRWKGLLAWAIAGSLGFVIVSPWLLRVTHDPFARAFISPSPSNAGDVHQMLPLDILWAPHNRELLDIATFGLSGVGGWLGMPATGRVISAAWWLLCIWLARGRTREGIEPWRPLALLAIFCATIAALLEYRGWGVDFTRFASVSSALMSMFLPLSIAAAATLLWSAQRLFGASRTAAIGAALVAAIVLSGVLFLRDVVNPALVLTEESDLRALTWISGQSWSRARFAVNGHPWMGSSWVGSDGGYWISVVTGGRSTLPPLLYAWTLPIGQVARIDRLLYDSNRSGALSDPAVRAELRAAGVTHFYSGSRDDPNHVRALLESGHAKIIHRDGTAAVLQIVW